MKKIYRWFKKYSLWIIGSTIALFAMVLALGYERDKVKIVDLGRKMEALKKEKLLLDRVRDQSEDLVESNNEVQKQLKEKVAKIDAEIEEVKNEVQQMDNTEIVDRFNRLYGD